jgi:ankyrin repeat protein
VKEHEETDWLEHPDPIEAVKQGFHKDEPGLVQKILEKHPQLKTKINEPLGPFDSPAITMVRSKEMLDVLLEAGADINAWSRWWAGGFGLLDNASPELAEYAIEKGAVITIHAAARLGKFDKLKALIQSDRNLVNARGGDGQTPLHFASTVEIAKYLLEHGAEIDALDVDHVSTPAQYMIADRQEIVRFLIERGCTSDIFMAAALGDLELARQHLDASPDCVRMRVNEDFFPMCSHKNGGTIYQWTLGWNVTPHQVAKKFGHKEVLELLIERSPAEVKIINCCWMGDEEKLNQLLVQNPNWKEKLTEKELRNTADAARNNNLSAVQCMLKAGLPVDSRGQHGGTPLHWAAWHGNIEMTKEILKHNPPLEVLDRDFKAPPVGWVQHGSENGWHREKGKYGAVTEALIAAGAKLPEKLNGTEEVRKVLRERGVKE